MDSDNTRAVPTHNPARTFDGNSDVNARKYCSMCGREFTEKTDAENANTKIKLRTNQFPALPEDTAVPKRDTNNY